MKTFVFDGYTILAGQNSRENDMLTLGSSGDDLWFHAENVPGSHVVMKNAVHVSRDAIVYCARIAAAMSKSQNDIVSVIYTSIFNVEKKRFSKHGEVVVETFQRVKVKKISI